MTLPMPASLARLPAAGARALSWVTAASLALALAAGCTDDPGDGSGPGGGGDDCKEVGGQIICNIPELQISPDQDPYSVSTAGLGPGAQAPHVFELANAGNSELVIDEVQLVYTAPEGGDDGGTPAFTLAPVAGLPATVFPLNSDSFPKGFALTVLFTKPVDDQPRSAELRFRTNDPLQESVAITITTEAGVPRLQTSPSEVTFGLVAEGGQGAQPLTLLNVGSQALTISGFSLAGDPRFGAQGEGWSIGGEAFAPTNVELDEALVIPPLESVEIATTFQTDVPSPAEGVLRIRSDDPSAPALGFEVPLEANKEGPCIQVTPRDVIFGGKLVGNVATVEVAVTSCGTEPLSITGVYLDPASHESYGVDLTKLGEAPPSLAAPLTVPINETVVFDATFVPSELSPLDAENVPIPFEGAALIDSNAFESTLEVSLIGSGAAAECPTAVIQIEEGFEVEPLTVLHLDGRQSFAPFGNVANYQWSIVSQPEGSTSKLLPTTTSPTPVMEVNVSGIYTLSLEVRDGNGDWSCEPAVVDVLVQPSQAIHVELTWNTPGDPDETDTGEGVGSDMDLHFTHWQATGPDVDQDGLPDPWFDDTWDCFWWNDNPSWGSFDPNAGDDPSLDRDDTDGAGPENLNLEVPEEGGYRIGVHYWQDFGFGEATATVRVYSYGAQIYEAEQTLNLRDMWCVGEVLWPEATVVPCEEIDLQPVVSNYVNPFFMSQ